MSSVENSTIQYKIALTPEEIEKYYGISVRTLKAMRSSNTGPPYYRYNTRNIIYSHEAIKLWLESKSSSSSDAPCGRKGGNAGEKIAETP